MSQQTLPNNDPDLQLAKQVNTHLDNEIPLSDLEDPLVQALVSYKQTVHSDVGRISSNKNEVWNRINHQTQPSDESSNSTISIIGLKNRKVWAAAAVVLIAALFSFLYLQIYQQPELLAQSESTIQKIQLSDGSTVTLRPYSSFYRIENEMYLLEGEGYFEVTSHPDRTFTVETQTGRVSVLGTRFTLSTWGEQMQVYLEEGTVKVEALQKDRSVILNPGESASVKSNTALQVVTAAKALEFTDWLNHELIFEDKPARQVVQELEQQFNISVSIPSGISGTSLTGRLSLENLQTSLNDLELVLGGKFIQTGDRTYAFESN